MNDRDAEFEPTNAQGDAPGDSASPAPDSASDRPTLDVPDGPAVADQLGFRGDPSALYSINPALADELTDTNPVLLVALDGYVDAGSAVEIAVKTLTSELPGDTVVTFDADSLVDYRSRRPGLTFSGTSFTSYDVPHLTIQRLRDGTGVPFLLMTGPEPDLSWEKFCAAVREVIDALGIRQTISLMAIPMGVPHTRPAGMSVHATKPELVPASQNWLGSIEVPGHIAGLLEYRLGQWGYAAVGFAVHVPHYLARGEYPLATRQLLAAAGDSAGLVLPTAALAEPIAQAEVELAKQMHEHTEIAEVVHALEKQYDAFMAANGNSLLGTAEPIPTADEIAAQFEAYLAGQDGAEG